MRFDFLKGRVSFDMLQHWLFSNGIDMLSRFECPKHGVFPRTAVFLPRETGVHLWDIVPIFGAIHAKSKPGAHKVCI